MIAIIAVQPILIGSIHGDVAHNGARYSPDGGTFQRAVTLNSISVSLPWSTRTTKPNGSSIPVQQISLKSP